MAAELRLDFVCPKTKDDFIASDEGLFCPACEKHVVDYSDASHAEIVQAFQKHESVHCAILPANVLAPTRAVVQHRWIPWRKSAALLALFFVFGEVKTLLAQTKAALKPTDSKRATTPLGYQKVVFTGRITDATGKGIAEAYIGFHFLFNLLGEGKTDADGYYEISMENFGGIREVSVNISAQGYKKQLVEQISVSKPNPTFSMVLSEKEDPREYYVGGCSHIEPNVYEYKKSPLDIFGRNTPEFNTEEVTYLSTKLAYKALVTDVHGTPIPGAQILFRFPKNIPRQGFTDAQGKLSMNMQLDKPALHAHISISAPGYYPKNIPYYEFDNYNQLHKLLKKPVESPEVPMVDILESALPAVTETPSPNNETAEQSPGIRLYPNPANETVTVNLPGTYDATLQVADQNGRIILRKSSYRQAFVILETQNLAPGTYTLQVTCKRVVYYEKLVIVR